MLKRTQKNTSALMMCIIFTFYSVFCYFQTNSVQAIPQDNSTDKPLNLVFSDDCSSRLKGGWIKDSTTYYGSNNNVIIDSTENDFGQKTTEGTYLLFATGINSVAEMTRKLYIGDGPWYMNINAKFKGLDITNSKTDPRGFVVQVTAKNKVYKIGFNTLSEKGTLKISANENNSSNPTLKEVEIPAPKDIYFHDWKFSYDGNKAVTVSLDGYDVATFNDIAATTQNESDRIVFYNDMRDYVLGTNEIYINDIKFHRPITFVDCTVLPIPNAQSMDVNIGMSIENQDKYFKDGKYKIKASLYKDTTLIKDVTKPLNSENIPFNFTYLNQNGKMKLVIDILYNDTKLTSITKTVQVYLNSDYARAGQTVASDPGKVFLFSDINNLVSTTEKAPAVSGWKASSYNYHNMTSIGTILENNADASTLKLPVKLKGWFGIYIGYASGTDEFNINVNNSTQNVKIKSSAVETATKNNSNYIGETFAFANNFNEDSFEISPIANKKVKIAYVKLVSLTPDQINLCKESSNDNVNTVIYDNDGYSGFFYGKYPNADELKKNAMDSISKLNAGELDWCLGTTGLLNYNSSVAGKPYEGSEKYESQFREGDKTARKAILDFVNSGKAPIEILAGRGKELGIKVNASLRMDTFYDPTIYGFLNGKMYDNYKDCMQLGGNFMSYYYPKYRTYIKNVLKEAASFNNVSGVTLDFCRYPYVMGNETYLEQKTKVMNDFMRELRNELPKDKTITVRIPINDYNNYGLDVQTWVSEKLIDRLVPSVISNENFYNIAPYIGMTNGSNVKVYAGITQDLEGNDLTKEEEEFINKGGYMPEDAHVTSLQYLLRAHDVYAAGVSGIYLFNTNDLSDDFKNLSSKTKVSNWYEFLYPGDLVFNKVDLK